MTDWNLIALKAGIQLLPWQHEVLRRMEEADKTGKLFILQRPRRNGLTSLRTVWEAAHPDSRTIQGASILATFNDEAFGDIMTDDHDDYSDERTEAALESSEDQRRKQAVRIKHQRRELRRLNRTVLSLHGQLALDLQDMERQEELIAHLQNRTNTLRNENRRLRKELAGANQPWWRIW